MDNYENCLITNKNIVPLVRIGGFAALAQLLCIVIGIVVTAGLGVRPESAAEYFKLIAANKFSALLQDDFFSLLLVALYMFTFPGLFVLLIKRHFSLTFYAVLFTLTAVILCITSHSGFSLLRLGELYQAAPDEAQKLQLLAAGESIIAGNIWNSTAGFFSGIFLQGGGVLISLAMLGDSNFSKITIISGLVGNGLDLLQHILHYSLPAPAQIILYIAGPFYLLWYFMLARDLFKSGKRLSAI